MVDYKLAPGAVAKPAKRHQTDAHRHRPAPAPRRTQTCTTPALNAVSAIDGWQEESAAGKPEPFYDYVPFQKASPASMTIPARLDPATS